MSHLVSAAPAATTHSRSGEPSSARVTDPTRLAALAETGLIPGGLGSVQANPVLDRLARIATRMLGVPIALVSLVDGEAQHFAGMAGLGGAVAACRGTPASQSYCRSVVAEARPLVIDDASQRREHREHEAHRTAGVVAYLGVPLTTSDGATLGAFCAIDTRPRVWSDDQLATIHDLAAAAVAELELRIANRRLADREAALVNERSFLRGVLDALDEHVAVVAVDGRPLLFNRAARVVVGPDADFERPDTAWATGFRLFGPDGVRPLPDHDLAHRRVFATGEPALGIEYVLRAPDAGARTFVANGYPVRGVDGAVTSAVVTSRDVTAQRAADRALAEREARLDLIYNGASDLMFLMRIEYDAAGAVAGYRCESVNAAYRAGTGLTDAQLIGRTVDEVLPPDAAAYAQAQYARVVATGTTQRYDETVDLPGGRLVVETTLTPVYDADGHPTHLLGVARDVTARRAAEDARAASEAQLARIYNGTSDVMFLIRVERDAAGAVTHFRYESVNAACARVTGLSDAQVIGHTIEQLLPPGPAAFSRARYLEAVETGEVVRYDQTLALPAGRVVLETAVTPVLDAAGQCTHLLGSARDVSAVRRTEATLRAREAELRGVLAASPDCIKTLDLDGRLLSINETGCRLLELDEPDQLVGDDFVTLFVDEDHKIAVSAALDAARGGGRGHVQAPAPSARGTPKWWDVAVTPIPGPDGAPARLLCVSREITAMKRAEEELRALSDRDELTGLLNRRGFRAVAEPALAMGRRIGRYDALVYIDLDAFKPINDVFGHAAGDAALQAVARVLTDTVRQSDLVARLGGDEFAIYAAGLARPGEAALLATRLRSALAAHNQAAAASGRPWSVQMSVGVADIQPGDGLDVLLARADAAAYAAKRAGRVLADR